MRTALIALAAGTAAVPAHSPPAEAPAPAEAPSTTPTAAKRPVSPLAPFAAELAQMPPITSAAGWSGMNEADAWEQLANSTTQNRQSIRWRFAMGLIRDGRGADALGVLETMRVDDDDLQLVTPFQLARGAALAMLGRDQEAVDSLGDPDLAANPEACAWRLRALADAGGAAAAIREVNCALSAINGRSPEARKPFVLAAAAAAIEAGQPQPALAWLKLFSDADPAANILRGKAMVATGDRQGGKLRFERAQHSGTAEQKADAALGLIEAGMTNGDLTPSAALGQLETLRYGWRGGRIEEQALRLELKLATDTHDLRGQLRAGATLFRYYKLGAQAAPMLTSLQAALTSALAPDSGMKLPDAAGLYWDYRELAPAGAEGDAMVLHLADRLQGAGLYGRAAELLQYQLTQRAQDVVQGPLSVKVASLHILAGNPDRALKVLLDTEQPSYTDAMRQARKQMEAVALHRLGKDDAAMAALDGIPGGTVLKAEIHWRSKNWGAFVTENESVLPPAKGLNEAGQASVLRHAVALAMLGRESALQALRARYAATFKTLPSGQAFDILTRKLDGMDPAAVAGAMAAIPEASPAGAIGDLLDAGS